MIRKAEIQDYDAIMEIWKSAVKATHDFLSEEDFLLFERIIPVDFLPQLRVFVIEENQKTEAFFGVSDDHLEMLFVDAASHGKGYGKQAVHFIINQLGIKKVDVNEQNPQATGFYLKMGYKITGRSAKDGMGKDYPLLHMIYTE